MENITNYSQFRGLEKTAVLLLSGRTAFIEAVSPDPDDFLYADAEFGLRLTVPRHAYLKGENPNIEWDLWIDKNGEALAFQSEALRQMFNAALLRLPFVEGEMDDTERELCDYLLSNGYPRHYSEYLELARHFANLNK